jgi:ribosomal protein S18 acetylase RimI-like enzyme
MRAGNDAHHAYRPADTTLSSVDIRSLGYRTDLTIRVLEGSQVEDRGDYLVIRSPRNPTFWWGNFLLLSTPPPPGQAGEWLARFDAEFPGASHVALGVDVTDAGAVDPQELIASGLRLTRLTVLTASDVRVPPHLNTKATYRRLAGDGDWEQAAELRAVVSEGEPGSEPDFLQARLAAERAMTEAGYGSWFGAFIDGRLLAQLGLITGTTRLARYQNVETHPAARRQGLAGSLVWHAGRHALAADGASTLVMVADPAELAIRVYRSVGFAEAQAQIGFERHSPAAG